MKVATVRLAILTANVKIASNGVSFVYLACRNEENKNWCSTTIRRTVILISTSHEVFVIIQQDAFASAIQLYS
jgi:hypothetical protein